MKRSIILLAIASLASAAVFMGGMAVTDKARYNNDFVRVFPPHAADINTITDIPVNRFSIAGQSSKRVYLRDRKGILLLDVTSKDTTRIELDLPFGSEVMIDSPFFFIHNGSNALIQRGNLSNWKVDTVFQDVPGFTAIQMTSSKTGVVRMIQVSKRENILERLDGSGKYILQKQIDGILCTDGLLQYSQDLNQLVYLYRYRNQFLCLDSCLRVVRFGKTIDTTSTAKIEVAELDGKITMAKPPFAVNNDARVTGKYLFVQSNLLAKNESMDKSKARSVIDVYDITDGSYRYSFYINNHEGSRMQEFAVSQSTLVARFRNAIVTYDLPSRYLPR